MLLHRVWQAEAILLNSKLIKKKTTIPTRANRSKILKHVDIIVNNPVVNTS